MRKQPILLSWSGGKDAAWTLHTLRGRPDVDVVGLLTTVTEGFERIAMHDIRRDILQAQAEATGLPLIEARIPQQCDNAHYEAAFADALAQARALAGTEDDRVRRPVPRRRARLARNVVRAAGLAHQNAAVRRRHR